MAGNNLVRFGIAHIHNAHKPHFDLCVLHVLSRTLGHYTQARVSLIRRRLLSCLSSATLFRVCVCACVCPCIINTHSHQKYACICIHIVANVTTTQQVVIIVIINSPKIVARSVGPQRRASTAAPTPPTIAINNTGSVMRQKIIIIPGPYEIVCVCSVWFGIAPGR